MARFKKGDRKPPNSGRRKGTPNCNTREIQEIARELLDEDYFEVLRLRLLNGKCAPQVETLIHHFAFGRPKNLVEVSGAGDGKIPLSAMRTIYEIAMSGDDAEKKKPRKPKPSKPKAPPPRMGAAKKEKKHVKQGR